SRLGGTARGARCDQELAQGAQNEDRSGASRSLTAGTAGARGARSSPSRSRSLAAPTGTRAAQPARVGSVNPAGPRFAGLCAEIGPAMREMTCSETPSAQAWYACDLVSVDGARGGLDGD